MMQVITKDEIDLKPHIFIKDFLQGKLAVYPTDTIYGLGAIATDNRAVKKIRDIKKNNLPFSVMVPGIDWIRENCHVNEEAEEWIKKLPGPFTLILKLKKKTDISGYVNNGLETIGVRIPNHWMQRIVREIGAPIVSTAATGPDGSLIEMPEDVDSRHKKHIQYFISERLMLRKPSIVIDLTKEIASIVRK
ncbi:MAG TPA: threonylcarbamoyl-AMP synthase [Candidatus Woesearchaeota archaeon]|nr:threonylcarbamoyl-AMP synthase [Candidatus Woesearchaeota archaeon]